MSRKQPRVTARQLVRALERAGWEVVRREGSHATLRHRDNPRLVTVPTHSSETLGTGLVTSILKDAGLTSEELRRLIR